ncbi:clavaminate synthase-like protein [Phanerochaete sordida]|uniref:Clavaminate synthase-like protein n=1 Tax=Phanerochaete sordida TaxID=48140 RepID=A0A9P3GFL7_9APHY|nr:clavaminate synthase-like protein [Phanerochaete sordida]
MATDFSSIPVLDFSQSQDAATKPAFLLALRHALTHVGFFYLAHHSVPPELVAAAAAFCPEFFALPDAEKERVRMAHSPHFFGYSRLGAELTKGAVDQREQFDFGTSTGPRWAEGDPDWMRLWGPSQWPEEHLLPGFRDTFVRYAAALQALSGALLALAAEALGLPRDAFARFFETDGNQDRLKVVKYPVPADDASRQGVGPHYDGGFLTLLLQASPHRGLQVQNFAGEWIDAPPMPGTFVVNIGKALETITQGVAIATSHRVLSPEKGSTPRYSIPFFQMIRRDRIIGQEVLELPPEILKIKESRGQLGSDSVNYAEYHEVPAGMVALVSRIKSHPDVAQQHYPEHFQQFFPDGLPAHGIAY